MFHVKHRRFGVRGNLFKYEAATLANGQSRKQVAHFTLPDCHSFREESLFRGMFHVKRGVSTTTQLFYVKRRERMRSGGAYSAPPHVIGLCKLRKTKLDDIFFLFFACWCDDFSQQLNKLRWSNKSHLH